MLTLKNILKVCPEQKVYQISDISEIYERKVPEVQSIYDRYIINTVDLGLTTSSISLMLNETINIENDRSLYRCSLEEKDSFIRATLLLLADKHKITELEMFDIRRKMAIEIDGHDVKKSKKSKIVDYLLSSKDVDRYDAQIVRKYISLYFDLITVIFDNRGSILEYHYNINELTEKTPVLLLEYSPKDSKYYIISGESEKLRYEELDNLFEILSKWNSTEGELLLGLYNKKDMIKCLSKITVTVLREICSRYKITLIKPSERSSKSVKKSKTELYEDLQHILKNDIV